MQKGEFNKDELDNLAKELEKCIGDPRVKKRDTSKDKNTLNKILANYNYEIKSNYSTKKYSISKLKGE